MSAFFYVFKQHSSQCGAWYKPHVHTLDNECPVHPHQYLKLQRKHQETREGGELPTSHQVSPLQFKVSLVPSLHYHEPSVGGSLPRHILVTCEGWNHWPAIHDQTHLEQMMTWLIRKENWDLRTETDIHYKTKNLIQLDCYFYFLFLPDLKPANSRPWDRDFDHLSFWTSQSVFPFQVTV